MRRRRRALNARLVLFKTKQRRLKVRRQAQAEWRFATRDFNEEQPADCHQESLLTTSSRHGDQQRRPYRPQTQLQLAISLRLDP